MLPPSVGTAAHETLTGEGSHAKLVGKSLVRLSALGE
jgi:hypothetical protein